MRDSRTRTSANSAATKKPLSPTSTRARKRLARGKRGSSNAKDPRRWAGRTAGVGGWLSEVRPSRYERYYTVAARPHKPSRVRLRMPHHLYRLIRIDKKTRWSRPRAPSSAGSSTTGALLEAPVAIARHILHAHLEGSATGGIT